MSKKDNRKWRVKKLPAGTMLEIHAGYFIGQGKFPGRDDIAYIAAVGQRGKELARLIAAAPDLLAACKLAVRFVEDVCKGHQWPHENCEAWKAATAAIAKAKGE